MRASQWNGLVDTADLKAECNEGHDEYKPEIEQDPAYRRAMHVVVENSNHMEG